MKKIMLAAVAASFVSTGASAVQLPAEGEVCSSIHSNISVGINNPELSDYRKCVMIQHDIDTAFTYKTFWVRNGDTFTSFPVETLAKMNRGERVELIKDGVTKAVLEAALAEQREMLEVAHAEAIRVLSEEFTQANARAVADLNNQISDLNDKIDEIKAAHEIAIKMIPVEDGINQSHVNAVQTQLNAKITELNDIQTRLSNLQERYNAINDTSFASSEWDAYQQGIKEVAIALYDAGIFPSVDEAVAEVGHGDAYWEISQAVQAEANRLVTVQKQFANSNPLNTNERDFTAEPVSVPTSPTGSTSITSEAVVGEFHAPIDVIEYIVTVGDDTFTVPFSVTGVAWSTILESGFDTGYAAGFEKGFDEGYSRGYNDGFEDGYNEGYTDGFTDGVASVR